MEEEITRATAAAGRKTTSSSGRKTTSSSGRKTSSSSTSVRKKTSSTTAKKKPASSTAAKKKTSTSTAPRLTAAEKKLIANYRKCGTLQKQIIALIIEKVAGGTTKLEGIERMINDQSGLL